MLTIWLGLFSVYHYVVYNSGLVIDSPDADWCLLWAARDGGANNFGGVLVRVSQVGASPFNLLSHLCL